MGTRVACIGECMMELSERPDGSLSRGYGGDTLNTALYLARTAGCTSDSVSYNGWNNNPGNSAGSPSRFQRSHVAFQIHRSANWRRTNLVSLAPGFRPSPLRIQRIRTWSGAFRRSSRSSCSRSITAA